MNSRVERYDEGYAGSEDIFGIRRGEDVIDEGRISAGGVHGSVVSVERACPLAMMK